MLSTFIGSVNIDTAYFILDMVSPDIAYIISHVENVTIATVLILFLLLGMWRTFEKAGILGFVALIPFYNYYRLYKIAFGSGWFFVLGMIPFGNIIVRSVFGLKLAEAFGKEQVFGLGIAFLPTVFYIILGFGNAVYQKTE